MDTLTYTNFQSYRKNVLKHHLRPQSGFALPLAMGLGLVMLTLAVTTIMVAQGGRNTAVQRREVGNNFAATEGGIARLLAQLTQAHNAVLLTRNYDTINPETGTTYLGPDGILNSGDEEAAQVDQWTTYNPNSQSCYRHKGWTNPNVSLSGTIGAGQFNLRAYRYDPNKQTGTLLVESVLDNQSSAVEVTFSIKADLKDFPGVVIVDPSRGSNVNRPGVLALRGREILGYNGNVYYPPQSSANPSLTSYATLAEAVRPNYRGAVWSSNTSDGALGDTISGKLSSCYLVPWVPANTAISENNEGAITISRTLAGTGGIVPTLYRVERINLVNNDVLTVDTTGGPVHIEFVDIPDASLDPTTVTLRNNAKILNVRTDGIPPRVGDLRILIRENQRVNLYDRSCIQNAFLWSWSDEMRLLTSGPGCPGGKNTNFEGVAWVEAILSTKNAATNRNVNYLNLPDRDYDTTVYPGVTSGIYVPDDISSLSDLLPNINWPRRYQFGAIQDWKRVKL
ncbi:MAG: hypothetical protein WA902_09500 [Thermosynechococcaceae cyanobacterium]